MALVVPLPVQETAIGAPASRCCFQALERDLRRVLYCGRLRAAARSEDEETATLDAEKLRVYERERLRFYYAIVECDSAATAAGLYKQCDGLVRPTCCTVRVPAWRGVLDAHARSCAATCQEFERSSTRLDLRYVPDEQTFEGKEPRDIALAVSNRTLRVGRRMRHARLLTQTSRQHRCLPSTRRSTTRRRRCSRRE